MNLFSGNLFSQSYYKLLAYNSLLENVFLTSNSVIVNLNSITVASEHPIMSVLDNIQSCQEIWKQVILEAIMALIIMKIATYRVKLRQAHRVQQVLHPIQLLLYLILFVLRLMDVLQSCLQMAFRQLSRRSRHYSLVKFQLIHSHYPISLVSLFD